MRASALFMFSFIKNPGGWFAYMVSILMVLGTMMENVCVDCITVRNADREIRGLVIGV